ncbi:hypothetical protein HDR60_04970 [bacterium]|nr:hypothetical protein [bacterium]
MIKKFLYLMLAIFTFTACSEANENTEIKPVEEDSISNNTVKKEILFSNQKGNEKKRDIQTSFNISIDSDKYEDKELNDYQKALIKCEPFKNGNKTIIGFVDGQCRTEEIVDDKKVVCNFYKSDLETASKFYASEDSNILKTLAGKYNIDFKMDIPEFNVDKNEDDDTSFNFKFALPKIKIERDKSPAEVLIEESCK